MIYKLKIAGYERDLTLTPVTPELYIAGFVILGDTELTVAIASELLKIAPSFDVMLTAEAKSIPLIHEMSRQAGLKKYYVARKSAKLYMKNTISVEVKSITTANVQQLFIDGDDAAELKGKRVLIVDDVISTGASLFALETLIERIGATVAGKMAVLAEGDAKSRNDIIYLEALPLFNPDGSVKL